AYASSPVPVSFGPSRDGVLHDLQKVVDRFLGPGRLDVHTSYIGAHAGDPDPWMWNTVPGKAVVLTLIDKKYASGSVGWYKETGRVPVIDGVDDGEVFARSRLSTLPVTLKLPNAVTRFGFYVAREPGMVAIDGEADSYLYCSNRMLNDIGPHGAGALHAPYDGDVQMLVYDLSQLVGADTWLVACEYSDTGNVQGTGDGQSDDDYSDIVFMVSGVGVAPTLRTSIGPV